MKKVLNLFVVILIIFFTSCGSSSEERMAREIASDSAMAPEDTLRSIDKAEKNIGEITHLIKDTMYYGVTDTVEAIVSYNCPKEMIQSGAQTFLRHAIVTQQIKITPIMRARLIDPTGNSFKIVPITDTVQIVEMIDSTFTLWQWRVTPIKAGNKDLVLSVDMIIDNNEKSLKIYQDNIFIHIGFWTKFWNFIQLNWTYITYVLGGIGAIFAFIYKEKLFGLFKRTQ